MSKSGTRHSQSLLFQWELSTENQNATLSLCKFRYFQSFNPADCTLHPSKHLTSIVIAPIHLRSRRWNLPSGFATLSRTCHINVTRRWFSIYPVTRPRVASMSKLSRLDGCARKLPATSGKISRIVIRSFRSRCRDRYFPRFVSDKTENRA